MEESYYDDEGMTIKELFTTIFKHFKLLVIVFVIIVAISLIYIVLKSPTYEVTTTVAVDSITNLQTFTSPKSTPKVLTQELEYLITTDTVVGALERLDLNSYVGKKGATYANYLTDPKKIESLKNSIKSEHKKDTNLVVLKFKHTNKLFLFDFIEALTKTFNEKILQLANQSLANSRKDINRNLTVATEALELYTNRYEALMKQFQLDSTLKNLSTEETSFLFLQNPEQVAISSQISSLYTLIIKYKSDLELLDYYLGQSKTAVQVVDEAKLVSEAGDLNKKLILAVAILLGGALGLLATLVAELVSDSINDKQVLAKVVGKESTIIGIIPLAKSGDKSKFEVLENKESLATASYNTLGGVLLHYGDKNVFTISSLTKRDNNSYTVANLGLSLLDKKEKVLILSLSKGDDIYKNLKDKAILQPYKENLSLKESDNLEKITVITSNNESKVVNQKGFKKFIEDVKSLYDVILIDAPSYSNTSELITVSSITEGLILNIKSYSSSKKTLLSLVETFKLINIPILGLIYNNQFGKGK
ncbi:MAG: Wzz/FepE/Etk N-terminal domain-containing protein [Sphaerochaetaceae bacterium]